jgi:secreted trypsin-like serine protease
MITFLCSDRPAQEGDFMQTTIHARSGLYRYVLCTLTALALSAGFAATPASALVYQDTDAQSAGLGAGHAFLDGEAALSVALSTGGHGGCSGSLVGGGAFVLTAAHCLTDDSGKPIATSVDILFGNSNLDVKATQYVLNPDWVGTISGGGDLALIKLDTPILSIPSYQLDTASTVVGSVVTLAGYGNTGVGDTGEEDHTFGEALQFGRNRYDFDYDDVPWVYEYDFDKLGDNSFNVTDGPAVGTDEVDLGSGDSGGAALTLVDGAWEIVGVHEFTICAVDDCDPLSKFGEKAGDTSVFAYRDWLNSELAGSSAPVPEPATWALLGVGMIAVSLVARRRASVAALRTENA